VERSTNPSIREAVFGQLRVHIVRDSHDIWQQQAENEIQQAEILMQCSEDRHLKDS
jgi:hypothetical protein